MYEITILCVDVCKINLRNLINFSEFLVIKNISCRYRKIKFIQNNLTVNN